MNDAIKQKNIQCPYCWEMIEITVDASELVASGLASYTEDCFVCCRPILIGISQDENGEIELQVEAELG